LAILDRFRRQPEWKSPDPAIRAAAVRKLPVAENQDLLVDVARSDADPQVRRAALRKLDTPAVVIDAARADADEGVREAAMDALVAMASGANASAAEQAAAAVDHPRHLATLARDAALPAIRLAAVRRLSNDRALATLARGASDADVRREAVARIADETALAEVALKSEQKDVALAALERLASRDAIVSVAGGARNKSVAKRARAIADERWPAAISETPAAPLPVPPPAAEDDAEAARYERLLAEQAEEAAEQAARIAARATLCETVEAASGDEAAEAIDEATAAWRALPALEGTEGESLQRRFDAAADAWRERRSAREAQGSRRARMEAVCEELEAIAEVADPAEAERREAEVRKSWSGLQSMDGVETDVQERYARAAARLETRRTDARKKDARKDEQARARLEALCVRAEMLVADAAPSLKESERTLREARAALDDPASAGKRDRDALHSRLRAARGALYTKVQELRETEEWKLWANVGVQEELCKEAEALVTENDLPRAARALRDLDERWKQASQAPKAQSEPLWQRFRAARAQVRARTAAYFAEVRAARSENAKKKEALVTEAESLADSTDWARAAERLRAMQVEWRTTGPVTRAKSDELWNRFRAAGNRFFARQKEDRTRRRAERAKNLERKQALCVEAEALAAATDWDRASAEMKRLQAEWRATGSVAKDKAEALSARFRQAGDRFFERYKNRETLEAAARIGQREALCADVEALATAGGDDVADKLRAAQAAWRSAPPVSGPQAAPLQARYAAAVDAVIDARPEAFKGTDLDTAANRARLEALCASVEAMAPADAPAAKAPVSPAAMLAERWREALAANTMGAKTDVSTEKRERKDKVEAARAAWSRVGPVGSADRERLAARFREACRRALGEGS
jgi:hypothetical protein